MTFTISFGWWITPALLSIAAAWWGFVSHKYDGGYYGYDVVAVMKALAALALISTVWMVYFGIGWARS